MPGITEVFLPVAERTPAPRRRRGSAPPICPGFRLGFPGRVGHA